MKALAGMLAGLALAACAGPAPPLPRLELGRDLALELAPGTTAGATLTLARGDAARFEADQAALDVGIEIRSPTGELLADLDNMAGTWIGELGCFVAPVAGAYRLGLRSVDGRTAGRTRVQLRQMGPAGPADHACVAALARRGAAEAMPLGQSAALWQEVRSLWLAAGEPIEAARAMIEEGRARRAAGQGARAIHCLNEGRRLAAELGAARLEVSAGNFLGDGLASRGELAAAAEVLMATRELARQSGFAAGEAGASTNLGRVAEKRGNAPEAERFYHEALEVLARAGGSDELERALTLINLANSLQLQDKFEQALDRLEEAREILPRRPETRMHEANLYTLLGWVRYRQGQAETALGLYATALALHQETGNRDGEAGVLDRQASAWLKLDQVEKARASYEAALERTRDGANPRAAAVTTLNLGCLEATRGDPGVAAGRLTEALAELERDDPDGLAHAWYCRGYAERRLGRFGAAKADLERSLGVVDEIRSRALGIGVWHDAVGTWEDYRELYVEVLLELAANGEPGAAARAFEASDLARGIRFAARFREQEIDFAAAAPALKAKEAALESRRAELQWRWQALEAEERAELAPAWRALLAEQAALDAERRAAVPRFAEIVAPRAIEAEEVRRRLGRETALLSLFLGDEGSGLFLVTRSGVDAFRLPGRQAIESLAREAAEALEGSRLGGREDHTAAAPGDLAALLFGPVLPRLANVRRLLVVVDGEVHGVPLAALPLAQDRGELVVDRFELVYLPSAAVLGALLDAAPRAHGATEVAVFADPDFGPEAEAVRAGLTRLPHSRREAEALVELWGSDRARAWLGPEATRARALEVARAGPRILHFATHVVPDLALPGRSAIELARRDGAGMEVRGSLLLSDLEPLRLASELVVLSGCRSALGRHVRGDGLQGFARIFLFAGAARVVVSTWRVKDDATAELMIRFHRAMAVEGLSPSAALRQAQLELRADPRYAAPFFWAPFLLVGDPR